MLYNIINKIKYHKGSTVHSWLDNFVQCYPKYQADTLSGVRCLRTAGSKGKMNLSFTVFILIPQLNLEFSACLNTELLRRKGLKYASIPAPSLLEFQHLFFA